MRVPREREQIAPRPIGLSRLLLVEGETPSHFFEALAQELGLSEEIEIRSFGGNQELPQYLRTIASTNDFKTKVTSLGIARDAEKDAVAADQSVKSAVESADLPTDLPVHIVILPDDKTPGMIETLCLRSVASDTIMDCADGFFNCLEANSVSLPKDIVRDKHRAQVYLAGKDLPEKPLGIAAYKNAWPFEHEAFEPLKAFLKSL